MKRSLASLEAWYPLAAACALGLGAGVLAWAGAGWNLFFYDEWGTILYRREGGLDAFLAPHNGHLQATVIAIYRLLFATVGLEHHEVYRAVLLTAHVGLVGLVVAYARPRVGGLLAIALALLLLTVGYGWEVILWPINLGFVLPLVALVAALLLWDREERWAPWLRGAALLVALASSGLGIAVAVILGIASLFRDDRWRRIREVAIPAAAYLAWYVLYRPGAETPVSLRAIPGARPDGDLGPVSPDLNFAQAPNYAFDLAQAAANGLIGLSPDSGPIALLGVLAAIALLLRWRRRVPPHAIALAVGLVSYWALISLTRADLQEPFSSRYIYPGAALLILIFAELLRGITIPRWAGAAAVVAALAISASNVSTLKDIADTADGVFDEHRAQLRELADPRQGSDSLARPPDRDALPFLVRGPYLEAVRELGYPEGTLP